MSDAKGKKRWKWNSKTSHHDEKALEIQADANLPLAQQTTRDELEYFEIQKSCRSLFRVRKHFPTSQQKSWIEPLQRDQRIFLFLHKKWQHAKWSKGGKFSGKIKKVSGGKQTKHLSPEKKNRHHRHSTHFPEIFSSVKRCEPETWIIFNLRWSERT